MQITIFGATGRTGRILLPRALDEGHRVTVLVRDPAKLVREDPKLTVLLGNIHTPGEIEQSLRGAEAAISVLGPQEDKPAYEISAATAAIVAAMQSTGVRRLIMTTGASVPDENDEPGAFDQVMGGLAKLMAGSLHEDMRRSAEEVRQSELDWTIVRVPVLSDAPSAGELRVGYVGKGVGNELSRSDLAEFLLKQLEDRTYVRKAPVVSN